MSVLSANCPSCAAPIEFKAGSTIVIVCPNCRSVVARTDRALEDLGKVAEIVQTQSPLRIGLHGKYLDNKFELTGRAQLKHEAGGVWDEWYATFSNGWVGWLAEAQGKFYMTFYKPAEPGDLVPEYAVLQAGGPVIVNGKPFTVAEKGMATAIAAEGEIPYQLAPNETNYYADLSGPNRSFATIDYGMNPAWTFVGQEVTLDEIGLGAARPAERKAAAVSTGRLNCPNCGGPIELRAPDAAERVTCPNCDSLLDVQQGNLRYLETLRKSNEPYLLQIGTVLQLPDKEPMQIIGAVVRSVTIVGIKYFWQEYLLYNPKIGFRWLVQSDFHWNFVEPIPAGDVLDTSISMGGAGATVSYNGEGKAKGKNFKIFQNATAFVEHVKGEFYWRVAVGEAVTAIDFVNAPYMLSKEVSPKGNEVNWSLGTYLDRKTVEKAAGLDIPLPPSFNVAPNQPFAYKDLYKWSFVLLGALLVVGFILLPFTTGSRLVKSFVINLPPMENAQKGQIAFSEPFELKGNRNVSVEASAPINNSWMSIDVDLISETAGVDRAQAPKVETVPLDVEYYSGSDSDGPWTEGTRSNSAVISSVPAGNYSMRVDGSWGTWQQPQQVTVSVRQNVTRGVNFCCALLLLAVLPIVLLVWNLIFESRRWSESMFGSSAATKIHST